MTIIYAKSWNERECPSLAIHPIEESIDLQISQALYNNIMVNGIHCQVCDHTSPLAIEVALVVHGRHIY